VNYLSAPTPLPSFHHCDYSEWTPSLSIIPAVYLLAFLVGSLGNGLVLWAYLDRPDGRQNIGSQSGVSKLCFSYPPSVPRPTRSLTESLIASLALADLCFLVTLPLWSVYTALGYHWPFGQPLCQISSFLTALNMYASVFSLSVLSVERYWVLTGRRHSGHHPQQSFPTRAALILAGVWLLSCILALPGLLLRSVEEIEAATDDWQEETVHPTHPGLFFLSCQMDYSMLIGEDLNETEREHAEMWWAAILSLKSTLIGFLLPLIILLICYCSLAKLLNKHFGRGPRPDRKRQRRLLRVIVTLVLSFFLCWLPLHVNKTVAVLLGFGFIPYSCALDTVILSAQPYVTCIAYLNSCLNPLLYAACDPAFRKRCRGALFFLCNIRRRQKRNLGSKRRGGRREGGKDTGYCSMG
uniref:Apelin receptor 2 n=1 Tax=Neogobius melanostomus TaxID=47308 RepID=A0A8C6S8C1_9GOBI